MSSPQIAIDPTAIVQALEFYADESIWRHMRVVPELTNDSVTVMQLAVIVDGGEKARQTLAALGGDNE